MSDESLFSALFARMDLRKEAEQLVLILKAYIEMDKRESLLWKAHVEKTGEPPKSCRSDKTFIQTIMNITKKSQKEVKAKFDYFDNEGAHIMEDELKDKFFEQLANNRIPQGQLRPIAQVLHKISKLDYGRWYA